MTLPLLLSVPHAGTEIPPEAAPYCTLSADELARDGDEGAGEIYGLESCVQRFVTTHVARAIVDLNRAEDDRRKDGVIKTHTCWDVPVYAAALPDAVVEALLARYYRPYHRRLSAPARAGLRLAVDCHTMAEVGPPVAPDPGATRPQVCLSNADGTCPQTWIEELRDCFRAEFGDSVTINRPFRGGYITRSHAAEMPWVQLELSRGAFATNAEKRERVRRALEAWIARGRRERPSGP